MTSSPVPPAGFVKSQTCYMMVVLGFMAGFFCGIALTAYKLRTLPFATDGAGMSANMPDDARHVANLRMTEALKAEVAAHPENVSAWIQLGNAHFDSGDHANAIVAYEKAIALDPANADVLTDLGAMYREAGKPREAVTAFDRALSVRPDHEIARFNKGIVLMHDLGDRETALVEWRRLLDQNPVFMAPDGHSLEDLIRHYDDETGKPVSEKGTQP